MNFECFDFWPFKVAFFSSKRAKKKGAVDSTSKVVTLPFGFVEKWWYAIYGILRRSIVSDQCVWRYPIFRQTNFCGGGIQFSPYRQIISDSSAGEGEKGRGEFKSHTWLGLMVHARNSHTKEWWCFLGILSKWDSRAIHHIVFWTPRHPHLTVLDKNRWYIKLSPLS